LWQGFDLQDAGYDATSKAFNASNVFLHLLGLSGIDGFCISY